jgi:hypothetical protein
MSIPSCQICGNPLDPSALYPHPARRIYDPFECAIHPPVPRCPRCGYRVKLEPAEDRFDGTIRGTGGAVTATR